MPNQNPTYTRGEEKGQFTKQIPDEDYLDVVRENPRLTSSEVGDEIGVSRRSAHNRLRALEEEGVITSERVGKMNTVLWLIADE